MKGIMYFVFLIHRIQINPAITNKMLNIPYIWPLAASSPPSSLSSSSLFPLSSSSSSSGVFYGGATHLSGLFSSQTWVESAQSY